MTLQGEEIQILEGIYYKYHLPYQVFKGQSSAFARLTRLVDHTMYLGILKSNPNIFKWSLVNTMFIKK